MAAGATFWAEHEPSNSRALVEYQLQNKKLKLTIFFVRGNVIDVNVIRRMKQKAKEMLIW
jgi:hypothetical protein